jgi:sugar phosphate isomerase/epimerase
MAESSREAVTGGSMRFMVCGYGGPDELEYLPAIENLGVGIELQSYGLQGVRSPEHWQSKCAQRREVSRQFKGRLAIHGPFLGLAYNYEDYLLRDAMKVRMDMTYAVAREFKPDTLILHTGFSEETIKFNLEQLWLQETTEYWKTEIERYERLGITVVLENLLESTPDLMIKLVDNVSNPYLRLCFDIGHANIWSRILPEQWVAAMDYRLHHVHLHDNNGLRDQHLPAGAGTIQFDPFFEALGALHENVTVSLEVDAEKKIVVENLKAVLAKYRCPKTG